MSFLRYQVSDTISKINENLKENDLKRRRLMIWIPIDVIQPVDMTELHFENRKKSKLKGKFGYVSRSSSRCQKQYQLQ